MLTRWHYKLFDGYSIDVYGLSCSLPKPRSCPGIYILYLHEKSLVKTQRVQIRIANPEFRVLSRLLHWTLQMFPSTHACSFCVFYYPAAHPQPSQAPGG